MNKPLQQRLEVHIESSTGSSLVPSDGSTYYYALGGVIKTNFESKDHTPAFESIPTSTRAFRGGQTKHIAC
jgi:hypothetical protein